jgi:hypothetical protein
VIEAWVMTRSLRILILIPFLTAGFFVSAAQAARADSIAVDGGIFGVNGSTSAGGALSLQVFKAPVAPFSVDLTAAAPLDGRGFAATADGRLNVAGLTLGAGAGVGSLANTSKTGWIYDAIVAHTLVPHLALEGRVYLGPNRPSSLFAGLRLSF